MKPKRMKSSQKEDVMKVMRLLQANEGKGKAFTNGS